MSIHEQETRKVQVVTGTLAPNYPLQDYRAGEETCKIINYILLNTYMCYYIRIGDKAWRILKAGIVPGRPDQIRYFLEGQGSVTVPFYTKTESYPASNMEEYRIGVRDGCYFPTMNGQV